MGTRKSNTVYRRGSVYWHRDPVTGQRRSTGCRSKKAAEAYHSARELESVDPNHAAKATATLGEWVSKMLAAKTAMKRAGTADMYRVKAGHLNRIFGADMPLRDITAGRVDDYITQRFEEGASQSTIYREITVTLGQVLKAARRAKACDIDTKSLMPNDWSMKYTPKKRNLTPGEVTKLLSVVTEEQGAFIAFIIATGSRSSEATAAEPEDLDPVDMVCRIRGTKTEGSDRTVPVLPHFGALWRLVLDFWGTHGRGARWKAASHGIKAACGRAGIPGATPNDLRRTHASWLILAGVEQSLVSRCLGHRDQTMVARVYGQVTGRQLAALVGGQISSGTNETQSPFFARIVDSGRAQNSTGPLGGIGRHRGFKIRSEPAKTSQVRETTRVEPAGDGWETAEPGTKETQSGLSPALWGLAAAAHKFGLLPQEAA